MKFYWTLDLNEANLILGMLAKLPYEQVGELIPRLRASMQVQLSAQSDTARIPLNSDRPPPPLEPPPTLAPP